MRPVKLTWRDAAIAHNTTKKTFMDPCQPRITVIKLGTVLSMAYLSGFKHMFVNVDSSRDAVDVIKNLREEDYLEIPPC